MKKKLEILFNMYDINRDGFLTIDEIKRVLVAMLDLLGNENKPFDVVAIANKCFTELDHNYDGRISKGKILK
jgi:Ca2+-binding EF-hand superfamily protein